MIITFCYDVEFVPDKLDEVWFDAVSTKLVAARYINCLNRKFLFFSCTNVRFCTNVHFCTNALN